MTRSRRARRGACTIFSLVVGLGGAHCASDAEDGGPTATTAATDATPSPPGDGPGDCLGAARGTDGCDAGADGTTTTPTTPTFSRAERLSRFVTFLEQRRQALAAAGATGSLSPQAPGTYDRTYLLDPRDVTTVLTHALARYDSYIERVNRQMREEDLVVTPVVFGKAERPPGFHSPEEDDPNAGQASYDSTAAVRSALAKGDVWLTPDKVYVLTQVLDIPSDRQILSDGSATLQVKTGSGTDFIGQDTGVVGPGPTPAPLDAFKDLHPIVIRSRKNVVLRDFRVRMAAEPGDNQPLLSGGIQIREADNVRIEGLELLGFPRTRGVLRARSSGHVALKDNLIHGSYTLQLTRQVTGIEIDNERIKSSTTQLPINSTSCGIVGNFILGMLLDDSVYFNTYFRGNGVANGYETDGINSLGDDSDGVKRAVTIANNSIMDVGEGIDNFRSDIVIRNNHIERAYSYGLKVVHKASRNLLVGNKVLATGMASTVIADYVSTSELARDNRYVGNSLRHVGAFRLDTHTQVVPQDAVAGVHFYDTKRHSFLYNEVSYPITTSPRYWGATYCWWSAPGVAADANVLEHNTFVGFDAAKIHRSNDGSCLAPRDDPPVLGTRSYAGWTQNGLHIDPTPRLDHFGLDETARRVIIDADGGLSDLRVTQAVTSGQKYTMATLVARGSVTKLGVRDQATNWLVDFSLDGEGQVISQSGTGIDSASIYCVTDKWFLLTVTFTPAQAASLLTLRLYGTAGSFLDLGETRLDPG